VTPLSQLYIVQEARTSSAGQRVPWLVHNIPLLRPATPAGPPPAPPPIYSCLSVLCFYRPTAAAAYCRPSCCACPPCAAASDLQAPPYALMFCW
jgi:hypothetical protein